MWTTILSNNMNQIEIMYKEICLIYDCIKSLHNSFFMCLGVVLTVIGILGAISLRSSIEKWFNKEKDKILSKMLVDLAQIKQVVGKEHLDQTKYYNGEYIFPAISHKISFKPDLINHVMIIPIDDGEDISYIAYVRKGQLHIKFEKSKFEDRWISWIIIYNENYL